VLIYDGSSRVGGGRETFIYMQALHPHVPRTLLGERPAKSGQVFRPEALDDPSMFTFQTPLGVGMIKIKDPDRVDAHTAAVRMSCTNRCSEFTWEDGRLFVSGFARRGLTTSPPLHPVKWPQHIQEGGNWCTSFVAIEGRQAGSASPPPVAKLPAFIP
jgi:hypothetical protein